MRTLLSIVLFFITLSLYGQNQRPEDFGFRHFQIMFKDDVVDILVKSQKGDEQKIKPLLLFCQGSLPQPLIKLNGQGIYNVFPFNLEVFTKDYHLVIISKPSIPLVCDVKTLGKNLTYVDSTGRFPKNYSKNNLPDYYVNRNKKVLTFLLKKPWVSRKKLVVVGHSEGSTIAARLAVTYHKITHLIYASGNPMGRIMSIIEQNRYLESNTDSTKYGEIQIDYWREVVRNKTSMDDSKGDTYQATYQFSNPPINDIAKLKIPVLVAYGTKDWSAPFNDYMRVDFIRKNKDNVTFKAYIGAEHSFFPLTKEGKPDQTNGTGKTIGYSWYNWLQNLK